MNKLTYWDGVEVLEGDIVSSEDGECRNQILFVLPLGVEPLGSNFTAQAAVQMDFDSDTWFAWDLDYFNTSDVCLISRGVVSEELKQTNSFYHRRNDGSIMYQDFEEMKEAYLNPSVEKKFDVIFLSYGGSHEPEAVKICSQELHSLCESSIDGMLEQKKSRTFRMSLTNLKEAQILRKQIMSTLKSKGVILVPENLKNKGGSSFMVSLVITWAEKGKEAFLTVVLLYPASIDE